MVDCFKKGMNLWIINSRRDSRSRSGNRDVLLNNDFEWLVQQDFVYGADDCLDSNILLNHRYVHVMYRIQTRTIESKCICIGRWRVFFARAKTRCSSLLASCSILSVKRILQDDKIHCRLWRCDQWHREGCHRCARVAEYPLLQWIMTKYQLHRRVCYWRWRASKQRQLRLTHTWT